MSHISNFKYHKVTTQGFQGIGLTQQAFEKLWGDLKKIKCSENEKLQALNRLKEACQWFTRGVAIYNVDNGEEKDAK